VDRHAVELLAPGRVLYRAIDDALAVRVDLEGILEPDPPARGVQPHGTRASIDRNAEELEAPGLLRIHGVDDAARVRAEIDVPHAHDGNAGHVEPDGTRAAVEQNAVELGGLARPVDDSPAVGADAQRPDPAGQGRRQLYGALGRTSAGVRARARPVV